jgi:glutaredoxin-like protein NrdH
MPDSEKPVLLYALTTCGHCRNTKKFLDKCGIDYDCVNVDQTKGEEREELVKKVKEVNPRLTFPTLVIGDTVIVGFKKDDIKEALGI